MALRGLSLEAGTAREHHTPVGIKKHAGGVTELDSARPTGSAGSALNTNPENKFASKIVGR